MNIQIGLNLNRRGLLIILISFLYSTFVIGQSSNSPLSYTLPANYEADSLLNQKLPIDEYWWHSFNDALLDSLIDVAMKKNWDLLIAQKRVFQARSSMRSAYGKLLPTLDLSAGWNRARTSRTLTRESQLIDPFSSYFDASIAMSWEIDVFGSIWKQAKSQKNLYKASKADYYATMVSMAASLGTAYVNLRTAQRQIEVMNNNIITQKEIVRITEARYNAGLSSLLDVSQAKSTYYNTRSSLYTFESAQQTYINGVALLIGDLPSQIRERLLLKSIYPQSDQIIPISIPANLLRQRPDIRAAEFNVAAQAAALGATRATWFPSFFLNGDVGFGSRDLDRLFKKNSLEWQIAPALKWTIFNGGQRTNAIASAKADLQLTIDSYNLTVLTALQEVENALSTYNNTVKETQELKTAVYEAQQSFDLSVELYKMGLSAFINVVDAQQSLLTFQTALVNAEGNSLLSLIQLYQALGGGWLKDL